MREKNGLNSMKENADNNANGLLIPRLAFETLKKGWRCLSKILPSKETNLQNEKEEVWTDISALYYKYEDKDQKRAFREVVREISEKMTDGRWQAVYKKLYSTEKKCSSFHERTFARAS